MLPEANYVAAKSHEEHFYMLEELRRELTAGKEIRKIPTKEMLPIVVRNLALRLL